MECRIDGMMDTLGSQRVRSVAARYAIVVECYSWLQRAAVRKASVLLGPRPRCRWASLCSIVPCNLR